LFILPGKLAFRAQIQIGKLVLAELVRNGPYDVGLAWFTVAAGLLAEVFDVVITVLSAHVFVVLFEALLILVAEEAHIDSVRVSAYER